MTTGAEASSNRCNVKRVLKGFLLNEQPLSEKLTLKKGTKKYECFSSTSTVNCVCIKMGYPLNSSLLTFVVAAKLIGSKRWITVSQLALRIDVVQCVVHAWWRQFRQFFFRDAKLSSLWRSSKAEKIFAVFVWENSECSFRYNHLFIWTTWSGQSSTFHRVYFNQRWFCFAYMFLLSCSFKIPL